MTDLPRDNAGMTTISHILIRDAKTKEVLLNKRDTSQPKPIDMQPNVAAEPSDKV